MKISKIENVINYSIINSELYYDDRNFFYKDGELLFSNVIGHSSNNEKIVVLVNKEGKLRDSILLTKSDSKKYEINFNAVFIGSNDVLVRNEFSIDRKKWSYYLYNFDTEAKSSFSTGFYFFGYPLRKEGNIFFADETLKILTNLEIKAETTLWQYSVAELGAQKVSKILGVFGQVLVVVAEKADNRFMVLGLSIENGNLLWKHEEIFQADGNEKIHHASIHLPLTDSLNNRIVIFEAGYYTEIDAINGEMLKWINIAQSPLYFGDLAMEAYLFDPGQLDEDHIYFRGTVHGMGIYSALGIWNRKTDKLEFFEVLRNENGMPRTISPTQVKAAGNKVFALDVEHTLHIFEQEEA